MVTFFDSFFCPMQEEEIKKTSTKILNGYFIFKLNLQRKVITICFLTRTVSVTLIENNGYISFNSNSALVILVLI